MRKPFFTLLFLLFLQQVFAQNDTIPTKKKSIPRQDRLMIDLFHDNWLNAPDSLKTKWYSYGVAVSILYDHPISESNFSVAAGADIATHNVHNNSKIIELYDSASAGNKSVFFPIPDKYKKNKLSTSYADAVAELRFRTRPNSKGYSWKFSLGGRYGYLVNVHDTYKDASGKYKTFIFPNVTEQRYGAHFRAAYGRVGVFGFYSLTSLFEKNSGTELIPFSVGFSIMPM